jgi:hypothetical protein
MNLTSTLKKQKKSEEVLLEVKGIGKEESGTFIEIIKELFFYRLEVYYSQVKIL